MPNAGNPMAAECFAARFDFQSAIRAATLRFEPWQFFQASVAEERRSQIMEVFCTDHPAAFMAECRNQLLKPPTKCGRRIRMFQLSSIFEGA